MTALFDDLPMATTATVDRSAGFAEFWAEWPASERKVAKKQCLQKWQKQYLHSKAAHIVAAVRWFKTTDAWKAGFIPLPATWLNQERWEAYTPEQSKPVETDFDRTQRLLREQAAHRVSRDGLEAFKARRAMQ